MNWNPNAQMDFFRLINSTRHNVLKPYLMLAERDGNPAALVVGRFVFQKFKCHLGYKTISLGHVRELTIIYGGVLGCQEPQCAEAVFDELSEVLRRREADLVCLTHLRTDSDLFELASRRPGVLRRDHVLSPQRHWRMALGGTFEEVYSGLSRSFRQQLRRKTRNFEKSFEGAITVRCFQSTNDLSQMSEDVEVVARKTYQRGLQAGFIDNDENRKRVMLEAQKNWLRMYVLYLKGKPCAYWWGTRYCEMFHSCALGFDPAYREHSPGIYLLTKALESLCKEGIAGIDFGLGDAQYKQCFGDTDWKEASVRIFAPSLRGATLNLTQTCLETPARWLRRFLERTNLQQRLKTFWRRHLLTRGAG
jgi:hypothetical protein